MIKFLVLGFPHTATTYCYKYILQKFPDLWGVFEPFNAEVVGWAKTSSKLMHYSEGDVHHHFLQLPLDLQEMIIRNSEWLWDWVFNDKPKSPFLGSMYRKVLLSLHSLEKRFVVKDVCAWVRAEELVHLLPNAKFIFLLKDEESVLSDFLKLYKDHLAGRNLRVLSPRWGLGLSLFYRFFFGHDKIPEEFNIFVLRRLFEKTYEKYKETCWRVGRYKNVFVIEFAKRLKDHEIDNALRNLGLL